MKSRVLILFILIGGINQLFSLAPIDNWRKQRKEVYFGFGVANFLGDLGGRDRIGTDYSPVDLEFMLTRPSITLGYNYKLLQNLNICYDIAYLHVRGDDKLTKEKFRNNRNLNFKSNIFESSLKLEFVYTKSKTGHRYRIKNTRKLRMKNSKWSVSVFAGIGAFYFNPKGRDKNNLWIKLAPLNTEGQGLEGAPKDYKLYSVCIPMGISYKVFYKNRVTIGIYATFRKTFTDYIDDVSGVYYSKKALAENFGPRSAAMADPNLGLVPGQTNSFAEGGEAQVRGDSKNKDAYMSLTVTCGYMLKKKRKKTSLRSKF